VTPTEFDASALAATDAAHARPASEIAGQLQRGPLAIKGAIGRLRAHGLIE
jgi:hypothetical protein